MIDVAGAERGGVEVVVPGHRGERIQASQRPKVWTAMYHLPWARGTGEDGEVARGALW